ncbi:GNAT family N-acetyltransferase [Kitasatospora sp. NPDC096147]|uniref:GNAT family N-acetyltransferase n=1 Tax=Kitasatospora sp. NPDC096147 TaxID=3364093 RepID=UPI003801EB36
MTERSEPWYSAPDAPLQVSLVKVPRPVMGLLMAGDLPGAVAESGLPLAEYAASEMMRGTWRRRYHQIADDPTSADWVTRTVLSGDVPIGAAGFHGPPDERGMVEVGYGVDPAHRRRGYAKAILAAMIRQAEAEPSVTVVRATISPDNEASLATVAAFGFVHVGEQWDDEDGLELIYELPLA